jgi:hypothetical protein
MTKEVINSNIDRKIQFLFGVSFEINKPKGFLYFNKDRTDIDLCVLYEGSFNNVEFISDKYSMDESMKILAEKIIPYSTSNNVEKQKNMRIQEIRFCPV